MDKYDRMVGSVKRGTSDSAADERAYIGTESYCDYSGKQHVKIKAMDEWDSERRKGKCVTTTVSGEDCEILALNIICLSTPELTAKSRRLERVDGSTTKEIALYLLRKSDPRLADIVDKIEAIRSPR